MATNAFGTPTNLNQFNAIVNGSKSNSLVNQLFAGKTSQTTPMVATPNVVAASSQVKSPSQTAVFNGGTAVPTNSFGGQSQTGPQSTIPNTMSGTNGAPMSGPAPAPMSLLTPPINQPVTSHSVTDAQGNTVTQKYDTTATDTADTPTTPQTSFTTPSGATVDTNGNTLSGAPVSALSSITSGLVNNAGNNAAIGQSAADIAANYGKQIADVGNQAAINEESVGGQGLLPTAMGRAQQVAQTANSAQSALAAGESAALQGTGQQLTANSNAASALNNAGALSTPSNEYSQVPYGTQLINSSGQNISPSGGNLDPQTQATSLAQQVMSGKLTYDQAVSSLGYAGNVGTNFLNSAITAAGGNPSTLQASGTATQGIVNSQATQVAGYQSALQQGQNLQSQLSDLITQFGLNPNDVNAVNTGIQAIAKNTSDPRYQILSNYVNDIANTYAQVLTPPGGSSTDQSRAIATSMLDASASGQSILAVMQSLDAAAKAKIAGVSTTGTSSSSTASGASGSTIKTNYGTINPNL